MAQHYFLIQKLLTHQTELESKAASEPVSSESYDWAMAEWGVFQAELHILQQQVPWLAVHFKNGSLQAPDPCDPALKGPADPFAAYAIGGIICGQKMAEIRAEFYAT